MRREVQALVVHCTFMVDGCKWKGEVRHLEVYTRGFGGTSGARMPEEGREK